MALSLGIGSSAGLYANQDCCKDKDKKECCKQDKKCCKQSDKSADKK
jgi:hypothetical protein